MISNPISIWEPSLARPATGLSNREF